MAVIIAASLALSSCVAPRVTQAPAPPAREQPAAPTPAPPAPAAPTSAAPAPATPSPAPSKPVSPPTANTPNTASPGVPAPHPVAKPNYNTPAAKTAAPASPAAAKAAPAAAPPSPTLDLGSLEQRLKDTRAIGVFTKLSLKNQVDDLLSELRAYHAGSATTPQAALRQKYDTLIIKVLTLLQNGDPQLATAVASSREALWGILMDPKKFSQI